MKVELSIHDDAEMRKYIKDLIKGQIISITREELRLLAQEGLTEVLKATPLAPLLKENMSKAIEEILRKDFDVSEWKEKFVEPIVERRLETLTSRINWENKVTQVISAKIEGLIKRFA